MKYSNTLILASVLMAASSLTQASEVKTAGQAMTLCKAKAESAHQGYKRSKSTKIKQRRSVFKINMKVITESAKLKTVCEVTKDGKVSYSEL